MFDARNILDVLLGGPGGRPGQGRQPDSSVFKDMLDQLGDQPSAGRQAAPQPPPTGRTPQSQPGPAGQPTQPAPTGGSGGGISLEDLLRSILTGGALQGGAPQQAPAGARPAPGGQQQGPMIAPEVSQELQDLLRQILQGGVREGGGGTRIPVNRL
jgi:hypothetical protein